MSKQIKKSIFLIEKKKKNKKWTRSEDELLIRLAISNQCKRWGKIAKQLPSKTPFQCFSRYRRIRPGLKKGKWEEEEDSKLVSLVAQYGEDWALISKLMSSRNNKQVRDRYLNILNPSISKTPFSLDEDQKIIKYEKLYGRNWKFISSFFKGRTPDKIKNRFYTLKKRTKRKLHIEESNDNIEVT